MIAAGHLSCRILLGLLERENLCRVSSVELNGYYYLSATWGYFSALHKITVSCKRLKTIEKCVVDLCSVCVFMFKMCSVFHPEGFRNLCRPGVLCATLP